MLSNQTSLPTAAGIGLRAPHHKKVLNERPAVRWWEVHSENYFADGGPSIAFLEEVRRDYPISLHGVSSSLGGVDDLFERHLERLRRLVERVEPAAISEHVCWSSIGTRHFNDLLPLPYTKESLAQVCERVTRMQESLQRVVLVENVSSYVQWKQADFDEWEFLVEIGKRTGCRLLLDINNVYVTASNHGISAKQYIDAIPSEFVQEIHLAGFERHEDFIIDTHGTPIDSAVWWLFEYAISRMGPKPTLIEWDTAIPELPVLMREAMKAERILRAALAMNNDNEALRRAVPI